MCCGLALHRLRVVPLSRKKNCNKKWQCELLGARRIPESLTFYGCVIFGVNFQSRYAYPIGFLCFFRAHLAPRISLGHFFLAVFFRDTHDGQSERGTTRSLRFASSLSKLTFAFDFSH